MACCRISRVAGNICRYKLSQAQPAQLHCKSLTTRAYHDASSTSSSDGGVIVDLRSDVLTKPTPIMRQAMANATFNDDVFCEDPTVAELQDLMANMFGMEDSMFVPSGTMGNLLAVMCHCNGRGLEALLGDQSHLIMYEQGGLAQVGGIHPRTMPNKKDGTFDLDRLDDYVRPRDDPHQPWTALVAVEDTHNNFGGKVLPLDFLAKLKEKVGTYGIPVHMDGARVMNAAVTLDVAPKEILQHVDSVSVCLSKGFGAPIGSIISGTSALVDQARRMRKVLGGGWRQPGPLAAAALTALQDWRPRIQRDHQHAKMLADGIAEHGDGVVSVDVEGVHSNIVMVDVVKHGLTAAQFCDRLRTVTEEETRALGESIVVKSLPFYKYVSRLVTYSDISTEDIQRTLKKCRYVVQELDRS